MAVAFNEGRMKLRILKQGNERIIFFFSFFFVNKLKQFYPTWCVALHWRNVSVVKFYPRRVPAGSRV